MVVGNREVVGEVTGRMVMQRVLERMVLEKMIL